jgi:ribonuclease P/MRP protein subunit RPP40
MSYFWTSTKPLRANLSVHGVGGKGNWLTGRKQRVVLNGKSSGQVNVLSVVLQGAVLGPILFLVFVNNLDVQAALVSVLMKFASNTKLGQEVRCEMDYWTMQDGLDKMTEWAGTWGITKKCMVMHYGLRNKGNVYYMDEQGLQPTEEVRDMKCLCPTR